MQTFHFLYERGTFFVQCKNVKNYEEQEYLDGDNPIYRDGLDRTLGHSGDAELRNGVKIRITVYNGA